MSGLVLDVLAALGVVVAVLAVVAVAATAMRVTVRDARAGDPDAIGCLWILVAAVIALGGILGAYRFTGPW